MVKTICTTEIKRYKYVESRFFTKASNKLTQIDNT